MYLPNTGVYGFSGVVMMYNLEIGISIIIIGLIMLKIIKFKYNEK